MKSSENKDRLALIPFFPVDPSTEESVRAAMFNGPPGQGVSQVRCLFRFLDVERVCVVLPY